MPQRIFRLIELHQKIDERLRLELCRFGPRGPAVMRLRALKARVKRLIARRMAQPA